MLLHITTDKQKRDQKGEKSQKNIRKKDMKAI